MRIPIFLYLLFPAIFGCIMDAINHAWKYSYTVNELRKMSR